MVCKNRILAGSLLVTGTSWFLLGLIVAEVMYPGYSVTQMISDLGVGPASFVFNTAIISFGVLAIAAAWLLAKDGTDARFTLLLTLAGLGTAGIGLFPETVPVLHVVCAVTSFLCGGLCALLGYRVFSGPWSRFSLVLGCLILLAAVLSLSTIYLGLSAGGMERMIAYPLLIWAIGTGAYLMAPG